MSPTWRMVAGAANRANFRIDLTSNSSPTKNSSITSPMSASSWAASLFCMRASPEGPLMIPSAR